MNIDILKKKIKDLDLLPNDERLNAKLDIILDLLIDEILILKEQDGDY